MAGERGQNMGANGQWEGEKAEVDKEEGWLIERNTEK